MVVIVALLNSRHSGPPLWRAQRQDQQALRRDERTARLPPRVLCRVSQVGDVALVLSVDF